MDPEFSRLVDEAANIPTSGRWAAVNERIEHLSANPGVDNDWWVQLFGCLCFQVFSEYLSLKCAHQDKRDEGSLLAWRARNLLELSVWCLYCSRSRENARRLYEDAGRDVIGLFSAFTKWGLRRPRTPTGSICLRARSKIFPNGRFRTGSRHWMGLTSKSATRRKRPESATISVSATRCCPSSLTQPLCEY